jgi:hypothetical protein
MEAAGPDRATNLAATGRSRHQQAAMNDADRLRSQKLTAALHSPDFAVRWLAEAPAPERAEVLRRWSQPATASAPAQPRPGLRKCGPLPGPNQSQEFAAQLLAFSRSVGRVR